MKPILGCIVLMASPLAAQEFDLPQGCEGYLTIQSQSCSVSHYFRCGDDQNGEQRRATLDEEGLTYVGRISGEAEWRDVLTKDFDFIMQFWNSPKPTIAAAHGYCIGGAMELLMACDLAVAGETTRFGEPEVRFGSGIVAMLAPYVIGPKQAKELLLTGNDKVTAYRCYQMGILNQVVADGAEMEAALELANQIVNAAPRSVQMTKAAIHRAYELAEMRTALREALETDIKIEADESPERVEFNRIRKDQGLKAALAWRNTKTAG